MVTSVISGKGDVFMNITVIGRKCTPRDSFKERVDKKLSKVDKFFTQEADAKVTATVEKSYQTVEITVSTDSMVFRAQERADNLNDALDKCVDNLIRRIRKNKTKLEKKLRSGAFDEIPADDDIAEETDFEVVRTKAVAVKPQSVEEAILQMNLIGHTFYAFTDAETGDVCVVYKRKEGSYGLIAPER